MLNLGPFRIVRSEEMRVERQSEGHVLLVPEPLVDEVGLLKAFLVYSPEGLPFGILPLEQEHQIRRNSRSTWVGLNDAHITTGRGSLHQQKWTH